MENIEIPDCKTALETVERFVYWEFGERNADIAVRFLTHDVSLFGLSSFMAAPDRAEALKLLSDEAAGLPEGNCAHLSCAGEKTLSHDCAAVSAVISVAQDQACGGWQCRLSALCVRRAGAYLISSLHLSIPAGSSDQRLHYPTQDTVLDCMPGGLVLFTIEDGRIALTYANAGLAAILVYPADDFRLAADADALCFAAEEDKARTREALLSAADGAAGGASAFTCRAACSSGAERWLSLRAAVFEKTKGRTVLAAVITDMTEQKDAEAKLRLSAEKDGMTGLYNRAAAERAIKERTACRHLTNCALMIADVDGLKRINDTFGHAEGDSAIKAAARILAAGFRKSDVLGRAGGDEFIIFLEAPGDRASVKRILEKLFAKLRGPAAPQDASKLSLSLGAAVTEDGAEDFDGLYKKADAALYRAKSAGGNTFFIYEDEKENHSRKNDIYSG